jgi:putative FmdB family regulatory protein
VRRCLKLATGGMPEEGRRLFKTCQNESEKMPTYVYACTACKEEYELEQRITENAITTCRCGSFGTVKRVIQPVGIAFKGSGFYVNDSVVATPSKDSSGDKNESGEKKESADGSAPSEKTSADSATPAPDTGSKPGADSSAAATPASPPPTTSSKTPGT